MTGTEDLLARRRGGAALAPLDPAARAPASKVAVLACMDARLGVEAMFALRPGDAHVIRNAGGCVTPDALDSLRLSQLRGGTREIVLVHHEDCAALDEPAADLVRCLDRLAASPRLPHRDVVRGFLYTRGGELREIGPGRAETPS